MMSVSIFSATISANVIEFHITLLIAPMASLNVRPIRGLVPLRIGALMQVTYNMVK